MTQKHRKKSLPPPAIDICNVDDLTFDESKMTMAKERIYRSYIPVKGSYAYGPWITKAGSTSIKQSLLHASGKLNRRPLPMDSMSEEDLDRYHFISFLRHPLERALAGFHMVEFFWNKNWIDAEIDKRQLTWWNKTCLNSTRGNDEVEVVLNKPCQGSVPRTTTERRLRRLNDFLDDVHQKGFWDQHITPMTYLIATNGARSRARYYDIEYIDDLTDIIVKSAGVVEVGKRFHHMQRGSVDDGMDWVVRWKELVGWAPKYELARAAIEKLCQLYHTDVACLPYDVPECEPKRTFKERWFSLPRGNSRTTGKSI